MEEKENKQFISGWIRHGKVDSDTQEALEFAITNENGKDKKSYSWEKLENNTTGETAYVRLERPLEESGKITAVLFSSPSTSNGISTTTLRDFQTSAIHTAYTEQRENTNYYFRAIVKAGDFDVTSPIGRPNNDSRFYAKVAVQYNHLLGREVANPTKALADLNEVPLSTAQRWLVEARRQKFMAPGKRGRRSQKDSQ